MDLEEKFTKVKGLSTNIQNYMHSDVYYSQEYREWLEHIILAKLNK